jgi:tetratricopeptide (TPR) repeat protein
MSPEGLSALAALVAFLNILPNEFSHDSVSIVQTNPLVNEPGRWVDVWTKDYWAHTASEIPDRDLLYRPVTIVSFRIVRALAGDKPLWQNLSNLALHVLVCVLVARLSRELGAGKIASLAAGVVFAVMPIHTEAVAAAVGRADLLATLGTLATLLSHNRSLCSASRLVGATWKCMAILSAFFAVGAKESAIGLAALVPLFDCYWRKRNVAQQNLLNMEAPLGSAHRRIGASAKDSLLALWHSIYILLPVAAYLALRYHALGGVLHQRPAVSKTVNILVDAPAWQYVIGVIQAWGMYWTKMLWPAVLSVNYSINAIRLPTGVADGYVFLGAGIAATLIMVSIIAWRRGDSVPALLVAALMIAYAPTSNAFILLRVFFAERIWYLPSVWAAMLIGLALASAWSPMRMSRHHDKRGRTSTPGQQASPTFRLTPGTIILAAVAWALVAVMAVRCWVRNADWRNSGTLCAAAYRDLPESIEVLHLYGQWLALQGDFARGVPLLQKAVEMDLGYTQAHRTLGRAYLSLGDPTNALRHLQIADMQVPGFGPVVRGIELARQAMRADSAEAIRSLEAIALERPDDLEAHLGVVRKLRETGQPLEAVERLKRMEPRWSGHSEFQSEFAVTLVFLNRLDEAVERYRMSLQRNAGDVRSAVELAMLLLERRQDGDLDEAWSWADRANALSPKSPEVLVCRAELLALRGDLSGAIASYQKAIEELPVESPQRRIYEQRAKALGK